MSLVEDKRELAVAEATAAFEMGQRVAKVYAASDLVPKDFKGNLANCYIALELANRIGANAMMVMQNLYIVHGKPGWSSQFLIAAFNQCGRFTPINYRFFGEPGKESYGCYAYAKEKASGELAEGPPVTIQIAKDEGWLGKAGSKWKTMPDLMLRYRAAAFLVRTCAPEIAMGLPTSEELHDVEKPIRQDRGIGADEIAGLLEVGTEVVATPA
jgi:hypothetical protein